MKTIQLHMDMEGRWRRASLFFLLFTGIFLFTADYAAGQDTQGVSFRWAFGARPGMGDTGDVMAVKRDTVLKTGDEFKIAVRMKTLCYVYVLYNSSRGEISMLFPHSPDQFSEDYMVNKNYYIPGPDDWFRFDEKTGLETFYFLASNSRLEELESAWSSYENAEGETRRSAGKMLLGKVRKLRKQHRVFHARAERPIPIGGNLRGEDDIENNEFDMSNLGVDVSENEFYSKTITIDHR